MKKILIVEDQFIEANNLQMILGRAGYQVCNIARSVAEALKTMEKITPDLVLLDIQLKGPLTGIDLAKTLRERSIAFVYLSANSNKDTLDAAKATHPYGFLVKPFRERDVLVMLEIAHHLHQFGMETVMKSKPRRKSEPVLQQDHFRGIIGKSEKLTEVLGHLQIVAPTDTSVLILGESGTGKERIAECVHELSPRMNRPLVKVNCAALPESLIESILFGHEKGAFTGATEKRIGKFEQANGGTIFLDEIGELRIEMQVKLLRVLQEKEIERIGGSDTLKVDVRIIAATNRNLEKEVSEGRFRMDLYYRLNVFPLIMPSLRERQDDIPLLAEYFIQQAAAKTGKRLESLTPDLVEKLLGYNWPGNIRELSHVLERAVLMAGGSRIKELYMPKSGNKGKADTEILTLEQIERDHIIKTLRECGGKIFGPGGAAELLGINSSTLNSKIKKLGIEKGVDFS
jgi:two-component system, NtrC family, response regulator HydG